MSTRAANIAEKVYAMTSGLTVVGAPSSAGAYGPGQERTPSAFREHGLVDALLDAGLDVTDAGDVAAAVYRADPEHPDARNLDAVVEVCRSVADAVAAAFAESTSALVLGGDCTIEVGTVAGALRDGSSVALAYIDLDADLNTPETGDGILDWMGVAHLLGVPGVEDELASLAGQSPMLQPDAVRLMATDNITPPERAVIEASNLEVERLVKVVEDLEGVLSRARDWSAPYDRLLVHVDVDVLDFAKFPIAEHTGLRGGLELSTLAELLAGLCRFPNFAAITVAEINLDHIVDGQSSLEDVVTMLVDALTERDRY